MLSAVKCMWPPGSLLWAAVLKHRALESASPCWRPWSFTIEASGNSQGGLCKRIFKTLNCWWFSLGHVLWSSALWSYGFMHILLRKSKVKPWLYICVIREDFLNVLRALELHHVCIQISHKVSTKKQCLRDVTIGNLQVNYFTICNVQNSSLAVKEISILDI